MGGRRAGALAVVAAFVLSFLFAGSSTAAAAEPGPERPVSTPVGSSTANSQTGPAVASDGTNTLVVWADNRAGLDIYGARVSPSGARLDGSGFVISAAVGAQHSPAVVFDGADYFVVWVDGRAGSRIYGARVTSAGVVRDPAGVRLSSDFGTPEQEARLSRIDPAVAYDGINHLVVWTAFFFFNTESPEGTVFARHVRREAVPLGTRDIRLTSTIDQFDPDVAFDGSSYVVVYSDTRGASSSDLGLSQIYGTRVSRLGAVVDPDGIPISTAAGGERVPLIDWNGDHHLVAWSDIRPGNAGRDIVGARMTSGGVVTERVGFPISAAAGDQTEPDVFAVGSSWFVTWQDRRSQSSEDIRASRVTAEGGVVHGTGIAIATSVTDELQGGSAPGPDGTVAVVYQRVAPEAPYGGADRAVPPHGVAEVASAGAAGASTPGEAPAGALPSEARAEDDWGVGAVGARAGSLLRRRVAASVVLVLLMGLAGAVVLAALAGARRADRALPAFLALQRPPDAVVYIDDLEGGGTISASREAEMAELARLPYVGRALRGAPLVVAGPDGPQLGLITLDRGASSFLGRPILVEGRLPDDARAEEVAVDEELVERTGVGLGDTYAASLFTAEQVGDALDGVAPPAGPDVELKVVGVVRQPHDLLPMRTDQESTYVDHGDVYLTPGFWERHGPDLANFGIGIGLDLEHGRADVERLRGDASGLFGDATYVDDIDPARGVASIPLAGVRRAIDLETRALQGFAAIVAVAAFLLVGQALARQIHVEAADDLVLRAVGMTRGQLVLAAVLRAGVVGGVAAVVAVAGAVALSPLTPVGVARRAEVSPGLDVDARVLVLGAAAIVVAVCARAAVAAWRSARAAGGTEGVAAPVLRGRLARSPLPVSGWTALALALQRGRGGSAAPLRAAVAAAVVTVVAVTAATGFGASLDALDDDPEGYGATWDVSVGNAASPEQAADAADRLRANPDVAAFAGLTSEDLLVGPEAVPVSALVVFEERGRIPPRVVEGRAPADPSEIAFGGATLEELGLGVGDEVEVRLQDFEPERFRISGRVVLNSAELDDEIDSGDGGILSSAGQQRLVPEELAGLSQAQGFLVRLVPTADEGEAVARLTRDFPGTVLHPLPPSEVENVLRVAGLPALLAGVVAALGIGTTAHAMISTVRRRRRELAVLSGLGFVRRQVTATLAWVATGFALVAVVVGLPVGVALGRWAWRLTADALWVVAPPEVPGWALAVVPVATLAVVNATALAARSVTGRGTTAAALRTE